MNNIIDCKFTTLEMVILLSAVSILVVESPRSSRPEILKLLTKVNDLTPKLDLPETREDWKAIGNMGLFCKEDHLVYFITKSSGADNWIIYDNQSMHTDTPIKVYECDNYDVLLAWWKTL